MYLRKIILGREYHPDMSESWPRGGGCQWRLRPGALGVLIVVTAISSCACDRKRGPESVVTSKSVWSVRASGGVRLNLQELDGQWTLTAEVPASIHTGTCVWIVPTATVDVVVGIKDRRLARSEVPLPFQWDGREMIVPVEADGSYRGPKGGVESALSIECMGESEGERTWRVTLGLTFLGIEAGAAGEHLESSTTLLLKVIPSEDVFLTDESAAPSTVEVLTDKALHP